MEKGLFAAGNEKTIAMWLYYSKVSEGDNVSTVKRTEAKEAENGFLRLPTWYPTRHQIDMPIVNGI